jgi:hypothetical protein
MIMLLSCVLAVRMVAIFLAFIEVIAAGLAAYRFRS